MISKYRSLFRLSLLHDYFADGKSDDFVLIPSAATQVLLNGARLLLKRVGNQVVALTQVDDARRPLSAPPAAARLTFYLDLQSTEFQIVTNLGLDADRTRRRLYASNLSQNVSGEALHLSRSVEPFDPTRTYAFGAMARVGGTLFECIHSGTGNAPGAGSPFWASRGSSTYVTFRDSIPLLPRRATFTLQTAATSFRIRVFALDPATNTLTQQVREEWNTLPEDDPAREVQVNLASLPPARYRLDINGEGFEAYFDDEAVSRRVFGIVEIFLHLPATDPFALLDAAGAVREPEYVLRFANRRAFWKYVTPLHKVESILLNGAHEEPSPFGVGSDDPALPARRDYFLSNQPLALSEAPEQNLFDLMIGTEARPAPRPDPRVPGMLTQRFDATGRVHLDSLCTIRLRY